jgi:hypothetical protein
MLREGEADALLRTGIERALGGDTVLLKFFLDRLLPRDRLIKLDLPQLHFADDSVAALGVILGAVTKGEITPSEGAQLAALINSYSRAIDLADVVKRMDALEAKINGTGN